MASGKAKSIDEMDMVEMFGTMQALGVSFEGVNTLDEMRSRVRTVLNQAEKTSSWSAGQAFSVWSEAKEEDDRKRKALLSSYAQAQDLLSKMDEQMLTLLQEHIKNLEEKMKWHEKQLKQTKYFLLVAGEMSSGKSSLINLILGEEILPCADIGTTSTICELKFGEERKMVVQLKDRDPETGPVTKTIPLDEQTGYLEQISNYVHKKGSVYKKVELFWPHELLQQGIVIIDSPGVGESEETDNMVIQFLPEAFAFIYVANSSLGGGVQKDKLEKLLQRARYVSIGVPEEDRDEDSKWLHMQEHLLSKCALFVCNKWDQLNENGVQSVKKEILKKLKRAWPGVDPESQIIYMSTTKARTSQELGVISKSFSSLMDKMRSMVLKSIEAKQELHWRWLYKLLSRIFFQAEAHVVNAARSPDENKERLDKIVSRLEDIEKGQDKVIKDLRKMFNKKVDEIVERLLKHLSSKGVEERFTSWSLQDAPAERSSWTEVEEKVNTLLCSRFQEIVEQWEEETKVFASARLFLVKKFQKCYDDVEFQLQDLQSDATDVDSGKQRFRFRISPFQKLEWVVKGGFLNALGSLLIPVDSLIAYSHCEAYELTSWVGWTSQVLYKNLLSDVSVSNLARIRDKNQLKSVVNEILKDAKLYLDRIEARLPVMIKVDRDLYEQLMKEKTDRSRYQPLLHKVAQKRHQLALLGLTEVCALKIDREKLDWKEEKSSCFGHGPFGAVYQGTMRSDGVVTTVALKVWNEELDLNNSIEIMEEMKNLRELSNPHIVQSYGISLDKDSLKTILVMEKCKGNLKNHIFSELESPPSRSKDPTVFRDVCRWAKEITNGLAFIHAKGVLHRNLKLENILLTKENTVKIADLGLARAEIDLTGTFAGTPICMAPEVFNSRAYDSKADIYSLGLIMWEMWYGQRAFANAPVTTLQDLIDWVDRGNRPVHRQGCKTPPPFWEQLMKQCWNGNPKKRPTAKECHERMIKSDTKVESQGVLTEESEEDSKVHEKVAELASEEGMDEKTDDENKTETEDDAEEKKVIEERMVKSDTKVESQGVLTEESEEDSEVHEKVAELASEEDMDEKTDDETKTEAEDDAEENKVIEVESGAMVTSKGTRWASKEWAVLLTLPPDAVSERTSIVVHRWEYSVLSPPLQEHEAITSNVIELSSINGQQLKFNTKVKLSLSHSATDLWGYELVIKKLTDKKANKWEDLDETRDMRCCQDVDDNHPSHMKIPEFFFPIAQADISECSAYAVVCRLKASPTYTITSAGGSFSHPDFPGVTVTIPENAVAPNANFPLELKVQEVSNEEFKGEGIFLGPVLRIKCFEAVPFFKPVNIQLPISLREQQDLNLNSTACHVRVLFLKSDGDQKEWIEITDDLVKPPSLDGKFVRFHVERFSAYSHYVEKRTSKHSGFNRQTIKKFHNSRIFVQPRLTVFFAYFRPDLLKILCLMCCPAHLKGKVVKELEEQGITPIWKNSKKDMTPGHDEASVFVSEGIYPYKRRDMEEIYLRLLEHDPDDAELEVCFCHDKDVARVEFYNILKARAPPLCRLHLRTPTQGKDRSDSLGHSQRPNALMEGSPTEHKLELLSKKVSNDWRTLGRRLTFQEAELQEYENGNQQISEKARAMLIAWKQREGSAATYKVLSQALCDAYVNRKDLAEEFCCYTSY